MTNPRKHNQAQLQNKIKTRTETHNQHRRHARTLTEQWTTNRGSNTPEPARNRAAEDCRSTRNTCKSQRTSFPRDNKTRREQHRANLHQGSWLLLCAKQIDSTDLNDRETKTQTKQQAKKRDTKLHHEASRHEDHYELQREKPIIWVTTVNAVWQQNKQWTKQSKTASGKVIMAVEQRQRYIKVERNSTPERSTGGKRVCRTPEGLNLRTTTRWNSNTKRKEAIRTTAITQQCNGSGSGSRHAHSDANRENKIQAQLQNKTMQCLIQASTRTLGRNDKTEKAQCKRNYTTKQRQSDAVTENCYEWKTQWSRLSHKQQ